jgi:hypothetical protein
MIGVIANQAEVSVVREFFEIFKTPWEFYRDGYRYEAILCCGDNSFEIPPAPLVIIYAQFERPSDDALSGSRKSAADGARMLSYHGTPLPLYRGSVTFHQSVDSPLRDLESQQPAMLETNRNGIRLIRIGYDLFAEVDYLLKIGQPVSQAAIPTLDLHIALLRDLIRSAGVPLVEIPPVPHGYRLLTCLTHDVDHPFVHHHKLDRTMFGFLYRALISSTLDLVRRRTSASNWFRNVFAALKLPFVYLGLAEDFWSRFERYLEIENGRQSTFFIIPFSNTEGRRPDGMAPKTRAAAYGASDVTDQVRRLSAAGCEVALHGIDAWLDDARGRDELNAIRSLTGAEDIGVRMHWLYFNGQSSLMLEKAGAMYDSTVGYNETVGFRAGTSQVYKPLNATTLLELPLHVMDTALFYPAHLHLSPKEAEVRINHVIDAVVQHGGCLTVNWHDRSIAPERLWTDTYVNLVGELTDKGAWFATAGQAIAWFRMRRSVVFETDAHGTLRITAPTRVESLPALTLRSWDSSGRAMEVAFSETTEVSPMPEIALSEL